LVVAKVIGSACLGGIAVGDVFKIETFFEQFGARHFGFAFAIEGLQDVKIFSQAVIGVANQVFLVVSGAVVVGIATVVATEFLIAATDDFFSTFRTVFFHDYNFVGGLLLFLLFLLMPCSVSNVGYFRLSRKVSKKTQIFESFISMQRVIRGVVARFFLLKW